MQTTYVQVAASGMVINTLGWVEGLGYELLLHVVRSMKVRAAHMYTCVLCVFTACAWGYELLLHVVRSMKVRFLNAALKCCISVCYCMRMGLQAAAAHCVLHEGEKKLSRFVCCLLMLHVCVETATHAHTHTKHTLCLQADVVVVMEQDRLYSQLRSALASDSGSMGRPLQVCARACCYCDCD